ncbi:C6 zinc cluster transcription factor-like protein [Parahypoxylon ruwenzoriense]
MSLEVIYVTRHGFRSAWSVEPSTGNYTAYIRSPTGLPTDPALTSHGVDQANELASHLLKLDPPIEQVYSSPYYRCLQTIQPFVRNFSRIKAQSYGNVSGRPTFEIRADLGLSEWYGLASFEHPPSAPLDELQSYFPEIDATYASTLAPSRHGESLPHLHSRVAKVIDTIIRRSDREGHKAVMICTHAAVVIALGRVLTGRMEEDFDAFTCGLSAYRRQGSQGIQTFMDSNDESNPYSVASAARGEKQIGGPGSTTRSEADPAGGVDRHPHDSRWPDPAPSQMRGTGLHGGWICELDSDCSFLSGGEERGWRFSGDESFIELDGSGLRPSNAASESSTAVNRTRVETSNSHANEISKL